MRAVGKAKDLILTGRIMDAAEAERSGLGARVAPLADLMAEAMKTAETIASMSSRCRPSWLRRNPGFLTTIKTVAQKCMAGMAYR